LQSSTSDEVSSASRERGGIQSLERAFAILEEVSRHREGISLADLARHVGLHNSTAFHLVKTMASLGYIQQTQESKRYCIGRHLFAVAAGARRELDLARVARPILEALAHKTGECSHFAVLSGDNVIVLAKTAGSGLFQVAEQVGIVRPAHATALGKVLLAAFTVPQLERYLASHELKQFTPRTLIEPDALLREIDVVRRSGIGFDDTEFDPEGRCAAVPVHDFTGQVAGAIGISGPIWRLSLQALQDKAQEVRLAGMNLSRELGFGER
jgi:IclR family transcriptional regulator, KDG regulon repressor